MVLNLLHRLGLKRFVILLSLLISGLVSCAILVIFHIFQGYVDGLGYVFALIFPFIATVFLVYEFSKTALSIETTKKRIRDSNSELESVLAEIKTLNGLLPICASCKSIRDDKGYWNKIEDYLSKHANARFNHWLCPDCEKKQETGE